MSEGGMSDPPPPGLTDAELLRWHIETFEDARASCEIEVRLLKAERDELLARLMRRIEYCIECPARWNGQECGRCQEDRALIARIEGKT